MVETRLTYFQQTAQLEHSSWWIALPSSEILSNPEPFFHYSLPDRENDASILKSELTILFPCVLELTSSTKVSGAALAWQQLVAMLTKRIHHSRRDWKGLIAQIVLPVLFMVFAMGLGSIKNDLRHYPELELSPALYKFGPSYSFFRSVCMWERLSRVLFFEHVWDALLFQFIWQSLTNAFETLKAANNLSKTPEKQVMTNSGKHCPWFKQSLNFEEYHKAKKLITMKFLSRGISLIIY